MKHYLYLFLFLSVVNFSWSQDLNREPINGQINVESNDVEGISVYNTSTNKGTITNSEGKFVIEAGLNDKLEISALQFKKRTIVINDLMLKNKSIKISLAEAINALDEVTVLPYELSGNIDVDVQTAEVIKPVAFSFGSFYDYEFSDDYKSEVENIAMNNVTYNNGLNFVNIFNELIKPLLKNKTKKDKKDKRLNTGRPPSLANKYTVHFLSKNFNIPEDKTGLFVEYIDYNGLTETLLEKGNEIELITFLQEKSEQFLLEISDKD